MKIKLITLIALLLSVASYGQSIIKSGIDSGGATATAGNIQVLYTIGEVVVQEASAGNIIISEGFIDGKLGTTLSAEQLDVFNKLKIYPNPTTSVLYIKNINSKALKSITLYDVTGKKIFSKALTNSVNTQDISLKNLPNGLYLLKLESNSATLTKRIIKQ